MGFDTNGTKFLLFAKAAGVDFRRAAMLGRQEFHLSLRQLASHLLQFDYQDVEELAQQMLTGANGFADPLLRQLGADVLDSFDYSEFEGANQLHDFNEPISEKYKKRYSVVIDGGTLEHVFHFPTAIRNCMEMLEVGGHFLGITPANNFMGHGFYQFSPEMYFRIFHEHNGFQIRKLILFEQKPNACWYQVTNPEELRRRVTLTNCRPTYLLVMAQRTCDKPIFAKTPMQSDYVEAWQREKGKVNSDRRLSGPSLVERIMPPILWDSLRMLYWFFCKTKLRKGFYVPIDRVDNCNPEAQETMPVPDLAWNPTR